MIEVQWEMSSPVGKLYLVASGPALSAVLWSPAPVDFVSSPEEVRVLAAAERQFTEYFAGHRRVFELALAPRGGTEFQRCVWAALIEIPFGQTRSYRDLARAVGTHGACRAVGSANARNPLAIVVPCHRVITSAGGLGGFNGGLDAKRWLLAFESGAQRGFTAPAPAR